jgi:2-isopropylmalate synthase
VDAVYRTIAAITQTKSKLADVCRERDYGGTDAQGEVSVRVQEEGRTVSGHGADTDIITAAARAYLNALNKLAYLSAKQAQGEQKVNLI